MCNGLLFVSPWLVGVCVFTLYPMAASLWYSFCEYSVLQPALFVGIENYIDLMKDSTFWQSLWNTLFYAMFALPLITVLALALASLLNTGVRGMSFYRTVFFMPSLTPVVAMAIMWLWILNGEYGIINYTLDPFLRPFGQEAPDWLETTRWSKPAIVLVALWAGVGHPMVIYLAGLQDVPRHLYEAADIDGASRWTKFRHVTLPLISPVVFFNVIVGLIGALQAFALPFVISKGTGGPARATTFYSMYLYSSAFRYLRMGYACTMAWIMFVIILGLTYAAVRIGRKRVYYGGA